MSAFTDGFADALAELDTDSDLYPGTFTWGSLTNAPCTVTRATAGGKLEEFGFGSLVDVIIVIRGSLFAGTYPKRGQTFTANGQSYGIDTVLKPSETPFVRIAGVSTTRGN